MKWLKFFLIWFLIGMTVFYHLADFSQPVWSHIYYVWDKGKDVLVMAALIAVAPRFKKFVLPIFIFSIIRFLWEVASWVIQADINNSKVIDYLFLLCLAVYLWIFTNEWKEWQK